MPVKVTIMSALAFNPALIAHAWNAFQGLLPIKIATIQNEAEYDCVVSFMNSLLDFFDDEVHELSKPPRPRWAACRGSFKMVMHGKI